MSPGSRWMVEATETEQKILFIIAKQVICQFMSNLSFPPSVHINWVENNYKNTSQYDAMICEVTSLFWKFSKERINIISWYLLREYCSALHKIIHAFGLLYLLGEMSDEVSIARDGCGSDLFVLIHSCVTWWSQHPIQGCNDDYVTVLWLLQCGS